MDSFEIDKRLPCGHLAFSILRPKSGIYTVRCITCKNPWVVMPGMSIIEISSIFTMEDLKGAAGHG